VGKSDHTNLDDLNNATQHRYIDKPTGDLKQIYAEVSEILRPKLSANLIEFAVEHMPSWDKELAHLMHAPMLDLTRREVKSVIFVGAARTGKTYSLLTTFVAYTILSDPCDMAVFMPSEQLASYYSKKRFGVEMLAELPEIREKIRPVLGSDTIYVKIFKSGMLLNFGWPSPSQTASKDYVRVVLSDTDRSTSVSNEGSLFDLAAKRVTTAMSRGMVLAESSPSKPVSDPEYIPTSVHDAPPTSGILGLYRQGTRCVVYSQCPHCDDYFAPAIGIEAFFVDDSLPRIERAHNAYLICTQCGAGIGQEYEREFKRNGKWVGDGQTITSDGKVHGELLGSTTSSYWLSGIFAAFQSWQNLVLEWIDAHEEFKLTGDEARLKVVMNTSFGAPYLEVARRVDTSLVGTLMARADASQEQYIVPSWARVLLAAVDIQGGRNSRFVVQVMAYGKLGERCCVDRFSITRRDDGSRIKPHANIEDWDKITDKVVLATYHIADSQDELRVHMVAIDSGGASGTTERAYQYYRTLKKQRLHKRVQLVKGGSNVNAPVVKVTYPDASKVADRFSGALGDIPMLMLNTLILKDAVKASIDREEAGANYFHMPAWAGEIWYKELTAETRTAKGWKQVGKHNETFDLCAYSHGLYTHLKAHMVDWDRPPWWLSPDPDVNQNIVSREERIEMKEKPRAKVKRRVRFNFN